MANIIIIGAGVAGLSAGIYARLSGHNVSIYERHFKSGGNLTGWDRKGYHIDNCIHWLTGTNPNTKLYKIWKDLGVLGDIEVYQGESLFTFKKGDLSISLYSDIKKTKNEMLSVSKEDEKEIVSFIKAVELIQGINGISGDNNDKKIDFFKAVLNSPLLLKYYNLSTLELANKFKAPLLQGFFSSIIGEEFSSLALVIVFATFSGKDGGIPVGSSCNMAKRMEERYLRLGGKLYLKNGVRKINVDGNKATSITLENGEIVKGDYIVVSGDPKVIFSKLLEEKYMPSELKKNYNNKKLLRFSTYHCAFSCSEEELPFRGDVIFEIDKKYQERLKTKYLILREFSHEKDFAPRGKNIIQTMTYCYEKDALEFIELSKDKYNYSKKKLEISNDIKEAIIDFFKELKDKLEVIDVWTPASYKRYTDSEIGSFMSFVLPPRTLPIKISNRVKGLKNVILASQWLQMPGGLPIAAKVGKTAISTINKLEK